MVRKKVLVITYYWPPSGGAGVQRFLKFVKYFPDYGIDPVVLTCANPTYPIRDNSLSDDIPEHIPVHYARTLEPFGLYSFISGSSAEESANPAVILDDSNLNFPQRISRWLRANIFVPDARLGWIPFARNKALQLIRHQDIEIVVTTGPPHSSHFIGYWLKKKTGIRWIADFRDPWTDIHYNRVLPRTAFTQKWDSRMERSVLSQADDITVTAPGTAMYFKQKVNRTFHVIPNGFDPDDFTPVKRNKTAQNFVIRHTGSVMETSLPLSLLQALCEIHEFDFRLEFIGSVHPALQEHVRLNGLENRVHLLPYLPHKEATTKMQEAAVNVVVVHRSADSRILIPGKLFDYLQAGRPVLVIGPPNGDAASIIRKCRIGAAFDYNDVAGLRDWIRAIYFAFHSDPADETLPFDYQQKEHDILTNKLFAPELTEILRYSRPKLTQEFAHVLMGDSRSENSEINEGRYDPNH